MDDFVEWCSQNHLQLNVRRTREIRRKREDCSQYSEWTPRFSSPKYLGVHLDNRLEWTGNTQNVYKKGQSRLYFLRRLMSLDVCRPMLNMFYVSNGTSHHTHCTWVPLHNILAEHRSTFSDRLILPRCLTEHFTWVFIKS